MTEGEKIELNANFDWQLLIRQKMEIYGAILTGKLSEDVMGVVHIIDDIQDYAVDHLGYSVDEIFNLHEDFFDDLKEDGK